MNDDYRRFDVLMAQIENCSEECRSRRTLEYAIVGAMVAFAGSTLWGLGPLLDNKSDCGIFVFSVLVLVGSLVLTGAVTAKIWTEHDRYAETANELRRLVRIAVGIDKDRVNDRLRDWAWFFRQSPVPSSAESDSVALLDSRIAPAAPFWKSAFRSKSNPLVGGGAKGSVAVVRVCGGFVILTALLLAWRHAPWR